MHVHLFIDACAYVQIWCLPSEWPIPLKCLVSSSVVPNTVENDCSISASLRVWLHTFDVSIPLKMYYLKTYAKYDPESSLGSGWIAQWILVWAPFSEVLRKNCLKNSPTVLLNHSGNLFSICEEISVATVPGWTA